jgi:hypothetical protein
MSNFAFDKLAIAKDTFVKLCLSLVKIMKISNSVIDERTVAKKVSLSKCFSGRFFILANVFLGVSMTNNSSGVFLGRRVGYSCWQV